MLRRVRNAIENWVKSSEVDAERRAREMVGGEEPLVFATATSLGDVASGRIGTLILTATHLHFVAMATRGYEPNPGLPDRRIDILLADIREVTTQGGALAARIATRALRTALTLWSRL